MKTAYAKLIKHSAEVILYEVTEALYDGKDYRDALRMIEIGATIIEKLMDKELTDGQIKWPAKEKQVGS